MPSPARSTGTSSGGLTSRDPDRLGQWRADRTGSLGASRVASYTSISVSSRSAARNPALSVRSSRSAVSRAAASGWSMTHVHIHGVRRYITIRIALLTRSRSSRTSPKPVRILPGMRGLRLLCAVAAVAGAGLARWQAPRVRLAAAALPTPAHVVIVVEENRSQAGIIGNKSAPFINALAARRRDDGAVIRRNASERTRTTWRCSPATHSA